MMDSNSKVKKLWEKAIKFKKISQLFWCLLSSIKTSGRFFQIFVAFSEKLNFNERQNENLMTIWQLLVDYLITAGHLFYDYLTTVSRVQTLSKTKNNNNRTRACLQPKNGLHKSNHIFIEVTFVWQNPLVDFYH